MRTWALATARLGTRAHLRHVLGQRVHCPLYYRGAPRAEHRANPTTRRCYFGVGARKRASESGEEEATS